MNAHIANRSNGIVPNNVLVVDCFKFLSGVNVTWLRIRARSDSDFLISSEVDVEGFGSGLDRSERIFETNSTKISHHFAVAVDKTNVK